MYVSKIIDSIHDVKTNAIINMYAITLKIHVLINVRHDVKK